MSYASLLPNNHDASYHQLATATSPSLNHDGPHYPGPQSPVLDNGGQVHALHLPSDLEAGLGLVLHSLTSANSYELVEADDYEAPQEEHEQVPGTTLHPHTSRDSSTSLDKIDHDVEQDPVRTASVSKNLPMNHPTPDLQSIQGAYVKNVERLEETAERLSMTSSLDEELQRMKYEQKRMERKCSSSHNDASAHPQRRVSVKSMSNSIIGVNAAARVGGYSPAGYITSPTGSIRSGAWPHPPQQLDRQSSKSSQRKPSPRQVEMEYYGHPDRLYAPRTSPPERDDARLHEPHKEQDAHQDMRPASAASGDTYRQASLLFNDFDGVHYSPNGQPSLDHVDPTSRRISMNRPPLARDSKMFKEAQPGEKMIFYPAPVPVMLNLPQRLSKMDYTTQERRRLAGLSAIPDEMRNSAPWLAGHVKPTAGDRKSMANLPPQLRASAFFEQPSTTANLQLKDGSAMSTLDSILDAAARAPVSAFTDHPIVGQLGNEVYGPDSSPRRNKEVQPREKKQRRQSSLSGILKGGRAGTAMSHKGRMTSRESNAFDDEHASEDEGDHVTSIAPGEDELPNEHDDDEERQEEVDDEEEEEEGHTSERSGSPEPEHRPGFSGAPTTLLAELQMRKAQQKQRNRTAADAFPTGMRATLLEMDAVAQLQQKARKAKHVTLAWEDLEAADRQNYDDDDVPLGVLFPEKETDKNRRFNKPMGLMEKREREDNEPLSHRRARLRGEPLVAHQPRVPSPGQSQVVDETKAYTINLPGMSPEPLSEEEHETLGQRMKRVKEEKNRAQVGDFAAELTSELGLSSDKNPPPSKTPNAEETLGQRRKRLKEEAALKNSSRPGLVAAAPRPGLKVTRSMADLLQANPVGFQQTQVSGEPQRSGLLHNQSRPDLQHAVTTVQLNPAVTGRFQAANVPFFSPSMMQNFTAQGANAQMAAGQYSMGNPMLSSMQPGMQQNMSQVSFNGMPYGYNQSMQNLVRDAMMGPPLDPRQRAMIDRWRQGIA